MKNRFTNFFVSFYPFSFLSVRDKTFIYNVYYQYYILFSLAKTIFDSHYLLLLLSCIKSNILVLTKLGCVLGIPCVVH